MRNKFLTCWLVSFFTLTVGTAVAADKIEQAIDEAEKAGEAAAKSQRRIDRAAKDTRTLLEKFRQANRQIEQYEIYVDQLEQMVASQAQKKSALEEQLVEIEQTQREITPLMVRMIDSLEQFIELDVPFQLTERKRRIDKLRKLMGDAEASVSERYRKILEAYQVENDYGRQIEAYRDVLKTAGLGERNVDFLRVGRLALYYQTLDGKQIGTWDPVGETWRTLDESYAPGIRNALRVARKQSPPSLLTLAVPLAQPGEAVDLSAAATDSEDGE